ncbi:MAG: serine protease [Deltaproteobacteria bacterium]|jgi:hypothetical protein|nr:serine protease [Deltaproteobacteria bacterium]
MKNTPLIIAIALFFIIVSAATLIQAQKTKEAFINLVDESPKTTSDIEKATFLIASEYMDQDSREMGYQYGTGFLVADGYIMTNGHVVGELPEDGYVFVFNKLMKPTPATVVDMDYEDTGEVIFGKRDFALLHFEQPKDLDITPVTFNMDVKKLDTIYAWGYPVIVVTQDISSRQIFLAEWDTEILVPINSTTGIINALINGEGGPFHVHTATIFGGNSGGPLVNQKGEVVGINTWTWEHVDGSYNLSQPSIEMLSFLWKNDINPKLAVGQILPPFEINFTENFGKKTTSPKNGEKGTSGAISATKRPPYKPKVVDLKGYDLYLSDKWIIVEQDANSVFLERDTGLTQMAVLTAQNSDFTLEEVATVYSRKTGGSEPELKDNCYVFDMPGAKGQKDLALICPIPDKSRHLACFMYGELIEETVNVILEESRLVGD